VSFFETEFHMFAAKKFKICDSDEDHVYAVAFHPIDSNLILIGNADGKVILFSLTKNEVVWMNGDYVFGIHDVVFNRDGTLIAAGGHSGTIMILNANFGTCCFTRTVGALIHCLSFLHDNKVVVGLYTGNVLLVNPQSNRIEEIIVVSHSPVFTIATSPIFDDLILVGLVSGAMELIDVRKVRTVRHYEMHCGSVRSIQWNHDGTKFVSASSDFTARLYLTNQSKPIVKYIGHTFRAVQFASLIHDDELLLTFSSDDTIKCWEVNTGKCLKTVKTDGGPLSGAISKDPKVLVIGYYNGSVVVHTCPPRPVYSIGKQLMLSFC
jgi:WD40 repeat protein